MFPLLRIAWAEGGVERSPITEAIELSDFWRWESLQATGGLIGGKWGSRDDYHTNSSVIRSSCASSTSCSFARASLSSTAAWWCVRNSVSKSESFWDMRWARSSILSLPTLSFKSLRRLVSQVSEAQATPLLFLALASDRLELDNTPFCIAETRLPPSLLQR